MRKIREHPGGFTLIEVLITLVIIGVLAVIMWNRVEGVDKEAFRSSMQADLKSVALAQEIYHQIHFHYGAIGDLDGYQPTNGVTVTLNHADGRGFAVTATHLGLPGEVCGYFVGIVPSGTAGPATDPGVTVCN